MGKLDDDDVENGVGEAEVDALALGPGEEAANGVALDDAASSASSEDGSAAAAAPSAAEPVRAPPKKRDAKKRRQQSPAAAKSKAKPDEDEDDEEYEVEQILDEKKIKGKVHFLIRWKGYQSESDTWEPENTLSCPDLIAKYKAKRGDDKKSRGTKRKSPSKKDDAAKKAKKGAKKAKRSKKESESDDEEDDGREYEVEKILEVHHKKSGKREFLIHWKGWATKHDTWEPEEHLSCPELIKKFMSKVKDKKSATPRELRADPKSTKRFTLASKDSGRRLSKRGSGRQRVRYDNADE